jgi:hypothetical protein
MGDKGKTIRFGANTSSPRSNKLTRPSAPPKHASHSLAPPQPRPPGQGLRGPGILRRVAKRSQSSLLPVATTSPPSPPRSHRGRRDGDQASDSSEGREGQTPKRKSSNKPPRHPSPPHRTGKEAPSHRPPQTRRPGIAGPNDDLPVVDRPAPPRPQDKGVVRREKEEVAEARNSERLDRANRKDAKLIGKYLPSSALSLFQEVVQGPDDFFVPPRWLLTAVSEVSASEVAVPTHQSQSSTCPQNPWISTPD